MRTHSGAALWVGMIIAGLMMIPTWADDTPPTLEARAVVAFEKLTVIFKGEDCDAMAKQLGEVDVAAVRGVVKAIEEKYQGQLRGKKPSELPPAMRPVYVAIATLAKATVQADKTCADHLGFKRANAQFEKAMK